MLLKEANQLTDPLQDDLFYLMHGQLLEHHVTAPGYQLTKAANEEHCYPVR